MPDLPARFAAIIVSFASLFRHRTWHHAEILLVGAILAPGKRTVTSILRITGLSRERHFVNYHRVLNRARWNGRRAAHLLFGLLIDTFVPGGPVILGLDDTIERRRGKRIAAKGIYRDPVRSSDAHFVKASGLRWLSLMLLAPIPWAARTWALPFLTALAPSERYCHEHGKRHKKLTDWARQMVLQVRRWLPARELVLVADMGFAALELLAAVSRRGVICITRLRLDAALDEPAPPRRPGTNGRPRTKGARLPNLSEVLTRTSTRWRRVTVSGWYGEGDRMIEFCSGAAVWRHGGMPIVPIRWVLLRDPLGRFSPQALLCTDPAQDPLQIIRWFILRWQVEVTFQEARAHLGVETKRQWSDRAVARTTPCLFGLFSIVTVLAGQLGQRARTAALSNSWYRKSHPTFSDSLAAVRRHIWCETGLFMSRHRHKTSKPPRALQQCLINALCYAAKMAKVELSECGSVPVGPEPAAAASGTCRSLRADPVPG